MLTQRDLFVATQAVQTAAKDAKIPMTADLAQHIAIAVVGAVDRERSPVIVGRDVLTNLLQPRT